MQTSYTHFTQEERESLSKMLSEGKSIRKIARELGKNASSVSREIARNKNKNGSYNSWRATYLYMLRRKNNSRKHFRLVVDTALCDWVKSCFSQYWSPEIIVALWKREHCGAKLSPVTVYRAIKRGLLPGYSPKTHLIRRGKRYCKRGVSATIKPERTIHQRCEEANSRKRIGDWEADTMYGAINKGILLTCIDRMSRYLLATTVPDRRKESLLAAFVDTFCEYKAETLTLDNGSEFADFRKIEKSLETEIYFTDPRSPWQRGSNENINGLLRFFFPKGTDFRVVTKEAINEVLELINTRPRKCLNWLSPKDIFMAKCCT